MPRKQDPDKVEVFNPLKKLLPEVPPEVSRQKDQALALHEMKARGKGRPRILITQDMRWMVSICKCVGMKHDRIARLVGVTPIALAKHFKAELEEGVQILNANVAGQLYQQIQDGNTGAMIFWLKTRAGWSEKTQVEQTVTINEFVDRPPRISREEWLNQYNKNSETKLN